jgi:hypothetical protein
LIAGVKKNHPFARRRVVKRGAGIFGDQLKERLSPGSTGIIKDFFAKLFELFNLIIRMDFAIASRRSVLIASML